MQRMMIIKGFQRATDYERETGFFVAKPKFREVFLIFKLDERIGWIKKKNSGLVIWWLVLAVFWL
jgi:hypothetical protein